MSRTILSALLIVLLNVFVGCHRVDSGKSQIVPARVKPASAAVAQRASEADIIEQMAVNRQAYRNGLELLIAHYKSTGKNMKLGWAKDEMKRLDKIPQYNYIIEAQIAGPNLRARDSISLADYMYDEALRIEKRAGRLVVIKNENLLRSALEKYNRLIMRHPSSDKIDDAAFRAGGICEHFRDYTIALVYYQRAYQWDSNTPNPAKYRAAYILDQWLHRRAEALELYEQAVKNKNLSSSHREFAKQRIAELTKADESLQESK